MPNYLSFSQSKQLSAVTEEKILKPQALVNEQSQNSVKNLPEGMNDQSLSPPKIKNSPANHDQSMDIEEKEASHDVRKSSTTKKKPSTEQLHEAPLVVTKKSTINTLSIRKGLFLAMGDEKCGGSKQFQVKSPDVPASRKLSR